jgi:hypothetical protein
LFFGSGTIWTRKTPAKHSAAIGAAKRIDDRLIANTANELAETALMIIRGFLVRSLLLSVVTLVANPSAFGQSLQREWVRTYFNVQTGMNQASAIGMAPDGGVIVSGSSQNADGDLDYEVIKYKANGDEAWKARYGAFPGSNDLLRGMTIDPSGNVIVTGTSDTVKFNGAGSFVWAVPLGGRAVVANAAYVYVAGFSDVDFATAQLENNNVDGKELWRRMLDGKAHGPDIGQVIALDQFGNVYVGGQFDESGCAGPVCRRGFAVVSYSSAGFQRWLGNAATNGTVARTVQVSSLVVRSDGSVAVCGDRDDGASAFFLQFNSNGAVLPGNAMFGTVAKKLLVDLQTGDAFIAGRKGTASFAQPAVVTKFAITAPSTPAEIWRYLGSPDFWTEGTDLAQDSQGNLYVTGFSDNDPTSKAMYLAKLDLNGRQIGLDRYNNPTGTSNVAMALAIDSNDNVYVTGYLLNSQGGSEFVTIKYSAAPKIEKKPSGAMHLEFHTNPGQQYSIEATTNFFDWQCLITNTADLNGLIQFDDTNAPTIPYRFYRGNSAP